MTILEQLQQIELGLRRRHFLTDHRQEIARAIALGELPEAPAWDPEARWPWLGWRGAPHPEAASRARTVGAFCGRTALDRFELTSPADTERRLGGI